MSWVLRQIFLLKKYLSLIASQNNVYFIYIFILSLEIIEIFKFRYINKVKILFLYKINYIVFLL